MLVYQGQIFSESSGNVGGGAYSSVVTTVTEKNMGFSTTHFISSKNRCVQKILHNVRSSTPAGFFCLLQC